MNKNLNLQDIFLNQVRKDKSMVTIFLVSGYQLKGVVKGFDNFTVILECDGKQYLIYKHAISTLIPSHQVNFMSEKDETI